MFGKEWEHLKLYSEKDKENQTEKVLELKQKGRSFREIGAELNISHMTAKRIWEKQNKL